MVSRGALDLTEPARWRTVDRVVAAYGALVAIIVATRIEQPGMPGIMLAHLAIPALAWLVAHAGESPAARIIRASYPFVLCLGLYSAIGVINGFGTAHTYDPYMQRIDQALFGMQPSRDWWRAAPSVFWSAVMHAAYLSYFVVVPAPLIVFLLERRDELLERYLDGLFTTFLTCYLCFILIPVSGPYYEFARPTGAFIANPPASAVYGMLHSGSSFGAAFPSSHVAAMVAATIGAWRGSRRFGVALAVPTLLLVVGVVYCQMHYVVDSVTGLCVGATIALWATGKDRGQAKGRPSSDLPFA